MAEFEQNEWLYIYAFTLDRPLLSTNLDENVATGADVIVACLLEKTQVQTVAWFIVITSDNREQATVISEANRHL